MSKFTETVASVWNKVKSNVYFVTASSAVFGALADLGQDYISHGSLDFSSAGLHKMGGYILSAVVAALVHLYRTPPPPKQP